MTQQEANIDSIKDFNGDPMGNRILHEVKHGNSELYVVYARIGAGKSSLITWLMSQTQDLVYFPWDPIYDDAQESNLGLQRPISSRPDKGPIQHRIMSEYWLYRLAKLKQQMRRQRIDAKIIADVPKFRARDALVYLGMEQDASNPIFGPFTETIGGLMPTQLFPMIGNPLNEKEVDRERTQAETDPNSAMGKLTALEHLSVHEINKDALVFRNVVGLDWEALIAKDKHRIRRELRRLYRLGDIPNPDKAKLPAGFEDLDRASQMIVRYDLEHMRHDVGTMGFDDEVLINHYVKGSSDIEVAA
jgi:hypothetical protein